MATRNLTAKYLSFRERSLLQPNLDGTPNSGRNNGRQKLLSEVDLEDDVIEMQVASLKLPPVWVDMVEAIKSDMLRIKNQMNALDSLHRAYLEDIFADESQSQDQRINALTGEITSLLRRCETRVKQIAVSSGPDNIPVSELPYEERLVRLNVMRAMGSRIQELSKDFRSQQKHFLQRMKRGDSGMGEYFDEEEDEKHDGPLFVPQQHHVNMDDARKQMEARQEEIVRIAQSINDLATIFREMSVLVVEQGSILDRIDYNVEQTLVHVQKGKKELEIAEEHQRSTRSLLCILVLLVAVGICITILVEKHRN